MPVAPIVLLGALVYAFVNFLRYLAGRQFGSAITMLVVWGGGIGAILLFSETQFGNQVHVGTIAVGDFNLATKLLIGFLASSLFAAFHDVKTAVDSSQTAAVPKLLPTKDPVVLTESVTPSGGPVLGDHATGGQLAASVPQAKAAAKARRPRSR